MPPSIRHPDLARPHALRTRCAHLRQRNPLRSDALLVCAWPGCPEGTLNVAIQVRVEPPSPGRPGVFVDFERESVPRGGRLAFRWKSGT